MLMGRMIAIVLTVRMALSMPRSPGDSPKSTGSVTLMIIRYVRLPPCMPVDHVDQHEKKPNER
jgi:hypothetical protein